jgi:hypothetical protein
MFKFNTMALAIAGASLVSASANAGLHYIEMTGSAQSNNVSIDYTAVGLTITQGPPRVDLPAALATVDQGGTGWPGKLRAVIDTETGFVVDFEVEFLSDHLFSADGAPQYDIRGKGRKIIPQNGVFRDGSYQHPPGLCVAGDNVVAVPGTQISDLLTAYPRPDVVASTDTLHVVHCPTIGAGPIFTTVPDVDENGDPELDDDGNQTSTTTFSQVPGTLFAGIDPTDEFLCATEKPTSLLPTENGCQGGWGDPFGILGGVGGAADGTNYVCGTGADAWWQAMGGINPEAPYAWGNGTGAGPDGEDVFCNNDMQQNLMSHAVHQYQWNHGGGTWYFNHTGSFEGGDFSVTNVQLVLDVNVDFPIPVVPGASGSAQSYQVWSFDTMLNESSSVVSGKQVPAMGAFGLAALFGGLIAVAARLRRRVA